MRNTNGKLAYRRKGGLLTVQVSQIMGYEKCKDRRNYWTDSLVGDTPLDTRQCKDRKTYWIDSMVGRGITGEKMASA
jgi:hypothetical protein